MRINSSLRRVAAIAAASAVTLGLLGFGATAANAASVTIDGLTLDTTTVNLNGVLTGSLTAPAGCSGNDVNNQAGIELRFEMPDGASYTDGAKETTNLNSWLVFQDGETLQFAVDAFDLAGWPLNSSVKLLGYTCYENYNWIETVVTTFSAPIDIDIAVLAADTTVPSGSNWTLTPVDDRAATNGAIVDSSIERVCNRGDSWDSAYNYTWSVIYTQNGVETAVPADTIVDPNDFEAMTGPGFATVDQNATSISVSSEGVAPGTYDVQVICISQFTSANPAYYTLSNTFLTQIEVTEALPQPTPAVLAETGGSSAWLGYAGGAVLLSGAGVWLVRRRKTAA